MMLTVLCRGVLLVVLLTNASWAQQTGDSTVSTAEETSVPGEESAVIGPEDEKAAATDAKAPAESAPLPAEPEPERVISPPGEYRASEQISDDSSVSFPVDI
jgi:hypothetical protein